MFITSVQQVHDCCQVIFENSLDNVLQNVIEMLSYLQHIYTVVLCALYLMALCVSSIKQCLTKCLVIVFSVSSINSQTVFD